MKKLRVILVLAVIAAAVIGLCLYLRHKNTNKEVEFTPVNMIADYYRYDSTYSGNISDGGVQYVKLREGLVNEILVSEGDTVKKGDVLMRYDETSYQLAIQSDEADIEVIKSRIQMTSADIARYRNLQPAENAPSVQEQTIDHGPLTVNKVIDVADMNAEKPVLAELGSELTPTLLSALRETGESFSVPVYLDNSCYGELLIRGKSIPSSVYVFVPVDPVTPDTPDTPDTPAAPAEGEAPGEGGAGEGETPEPSPEPKPEPEPAETLYRRVSQDPAAAGLKLADFLKYDEETDMFEMTAVPFAGVVFMPCAPYEYERYETIYIYPEYDGENYMYTAAELARMINDGIKELNSLQLDLREAEIRLAQDKLVSESGNVLAGIDGVVTKVNEVASTAVGSDLIIISGEASYAVTAYVGEMVLDTVKPGDILNVMCYESGNMVTAVVDHVEDTPADSNYYGGGNPNSSYYPVVAIVQDPDVQLRVGEWCEISPMQEGETDTFMIPLMYVRSDKGGKYVIKADEQGRPVKQYVKTGRNMWGYEVEILSGLTLEDSVAFPYGKNMG